MTLPSNDVVNAALTASRALLAIVARSVAGALTSVTLPEVRLLVSLTSQGPQTMAELAAQQKMAPNLVESNIDSLAIPGFVTITGAVDESATRVQITPEGRAIVDEITERRRTELSSILSTLTPAEQQSILTAFELFAEAAGEGPLEDALILGL
ncbi:MarR family winged helix-turn-helix transcriptional regulator [Herbiconiux sp. VKM Ac-2851]|uniref:MarR family winged helix-turn-helix transcriptional regulator n=1 Tax=Herbiconiux sp. VKM Ac-2851 TaxID=2739025 RepID=UPI001565E763|nr:hypothetical protein [Herbiconiux sp. VKM Ac-2851]NQX37051.1 hypothetical protein [Herbiconiux sp. VKM Ac-2851]